MEHLAKAFIDRRHRCRHILSKASYRKIVELYRNIILRISQNFCNVRADIAKMSLDMQASKFSISDGYRSKAAFVKGFKNILKKSVFIQVMK